MPNRCTRCGRILPDDSKELIEGCSECGSKFFFYIRQDVLESMEKELRNLKKSEIDEIEKDIRQIIPKEAGDRDTVVLDLEAIRVVSPGKYRIDVSNLFSQKPIVIRVGPGRYELDLTTLLGRLRKRKG